MSQVSGGIITKSCPRDHTICNAANCIQPDKCQNLKFINQAYHCNIGVDGSFKLYSTTPVNPAISNTNTQ